MVRQMVRRASGRAGPSSGLAEHGGLHGGGSMGGLWTSPYAGPHRARAAGGELGPTRAWQRGLRTRGRGLRTSVADFGGGAKLPPRVRRVVQCGSWGRGDQGFREMSLRHEYAGGMARSRERPPPPPLPPPPPPLSGGFGLRLRCDCVGSERGARSDRGSWVGDPSMVIDGGWRGVEAHTERRREERTREQEREVQRAGEGEVT